LALHQWTRNPTILFSGFHWLRELPAHIRAKGASREPSGRSSPSSTVSPGVYFRSRGARGTQQQRGWAVQLGAGLGKPQLRQRSKRISPTYVRNDVQFEYRDCRELNMMIFRLACCPLGTEVPLLSHDFPEGLPAIRRPTQDVLLRAFSSGLQEIHPDPPQPLRMVEEKPDRLLSGPCGTPSRSPTWQQGGLNGMSGVLRRDLHLREPLHIQPILVRRCGLFLNVGDGPLAHRFAS